MRNQRPALLLGVLALLAAVTRSTAPATAAPEYGGPYFGGGNLPPGCVIDRSPTNPANVCHHMMVELNALDSPQIDVLVLVPASAGAERDMRILRQAVEMWEGGIQSLAPRMGLDWLAEGVDFHITVDAFDPAGEGGEFTTYPVVDPEIVVIAAGAGVGHGIGIDPADAYGFGVADEGVPCHSTPNPFDFEYWEHLPGFERQHDRRAGTYTEDCGGAGGNICFAVTAATEAAPVLVGVSWMFDVVAHEVGHCLGAGHVGDSSLPGWGVVPTNDVMAYSDDPPDLHNCLSTLDVEAVALRLSRYLDTNGDGAVDADDRLSPNNPAGNGYYPFQVQHPADHFYASSTGSPYDCPQPDLGLVAGPRTNWNPAAIDRPAPHARAASHDDPDDDGTASMTEILRFSVEATDADVVATLHLAELWPSNSLTSPTTYTVYVGSHRYDSFVLAGAAANPITYDHSSAAYMAPGTSSWDAVAKTVTFRIPRPHLAASGVNAPFALTSQTSYRVPRTAGHSLRAGTIADRAPELGHRLHVSG